MDATLGTICRLLESPDPMRRHAAALVLAELAPREGAVVDALGKALTDANSVLTGHILDAFVAMGSPVAAIPYVMPLLGTDAMDIKLRAVAMVARAGERVVPEIRRQLASARAAERLVLVDLLARIHAKSAFDTLLNLLFDPDFEFVKAVCEAVRRHMADAPARARTALHSHLTDFMAGPRVKGQERVMTSCLLLLGAIGEPAARATLLAQAAPRHSLYVRRYALIGLRNIELEGAAATTTARQLMPYLAEPDEGLVRHVLDVLARVPAGKLDAAALLDSPNALVRRFAVRRLATEDAEAANRKLLALLGDADTDVREVAAGALANHKGAAKLLAEALLAETNDEAAWRLAKILKPHSAALDRRLTQRLAALAGEELRAGHPRAEALLYALRNVDAAAADEVVRDVGLAHKKAKHWVAAVDCLRRLTNSERFDEEMRYVLCVCNLKASPKDITPHVRAEDHALRGFQALLRVPEFKLADRLKKDKTLDAADWFYVGFHFAESTGDEKALGVALLEHLVKAAPKSTEGKAARNKLKLVQAG
jgi:HEAT repeat protein